MRPAGSYRLRVAHEDLLTQGNLDAVGLAIASSTLSVIWLTVRGRNAPAPFSLGFIHGGLRYRIQLGRRRQNDPLPPIIHLTANGCSVPKAGYGRRATPQYMMREPSLSAAFASSAPHMPTKQRFGPA